MREIIEGDYRGIIINREATGDPDGKLNMPRVNFNSAKLPLDREPSPGRPIFRSWPGIRVETPTNAWHSFYFPLASILAPVHANLTNPRGLFTRSPPGPPFPSRRSIKPIAFLYGKIDPVSFERP